MYVKFEIIKEKECKMNKKRDRGVFNWVYFKFFMFKLKSS